jgi:hypothetical protein
MIEEKIILLSSFFSSRSYLMSSIENFSHIILIAPQGIYPIYYIAFDSLFKASLYILE